MLDCRGVKFIYFVAQLFGRKDYCRWGKMCGNVSEECVCGLVGVIGQFRILLFVVTSVALQ